MSMSTIASDRLSILQILKELTAECLLNLLKSIPGQKDLVLDKEIICSLDYIANFSLLKTCGVEKIFKLEPGPSPGLNKKCIYLVRPSIKNARIISDHINANLSIENEKQYWVIYVPRKLYTSERIFEREGIWNEITQLEFPLGFVTLDKDLISLEISDFYNCFFVKGDLTHIHTAALALVELLNVCGPVQKIYGQGRCAKMVIDLMSQLSEEADFSSPSSEKVSHLIILDRDVDYVSVLLSQLSYEGVLDETFGINSGRIVFPKEVTGKDEPMKVMLNNNDGVYEEIKNAFFASVFGFLRERAKQLQSKANTSAMSIEAMKEFVSKEMKNVCQQHTSLALHIGACEFIIRKKTDENFKERLQIERDIIENRSSRECVSYIEDVINRQDPWMNALRLMCLMSITQNGLPSSDYKSLVTQYCQSYGNKHLITFHNLKKIGLLLEQPPLLPTNPTKGNKMEKSASFAANKIAEKVATAVAFPRYSSFKAVTKKFNLITELEEQTNLKSPQNMNYVFGGAYVPLIGRIAEQIVVADNFKNIEDGLKLLPGETVVNIRPDKDAGIVKPSRDGKFRTAIVFVLGGITYAEIAALRLLGRLNDCKMLIATTNLTSGNSLMQRLCPCDA